MRLSIVVPAVGSQAELDDTLVSVLENRPDRCEVIVAYRDGYVDPYALEDEVVFVRCGKRSTVVQVLNAGFKKCQGDVVHWILPGTTALAKWTDSAVARILDASDVDIVAPRLVDRNNPKRLVGVGVHYRANGSRTIVGRGARKSSRKKWSVIGPTLAAGFCRRSVLQSTAGFPTEFGDDLSDVAWSAARSTDDVACLFDSQCELLSLPPVPNLGFRAGRNLEKLYWQHRQTEQSGGIASHLLHVTAHTVRHLIRPSIITTLMGRFVGFVESQFRSQRTKKAGHLLSATQQVTAEKADAKPSHEPSRSRAA